MRHLVLLPVLAACCTANAAPITPPPDPTVTAPPPSGPGSGAAVLPMSSDGYRFAGDPCRLVGESSWTVDFLNDAADLVGCPVTADSRAFMEQTGGAVVAQVGDIQLFRVPRR
jgi:hypothetical protein